MTAGSPVLDGAAIRERLTRFVARWKDYAGSERSEAQTFLNELFNCYGSDRLAVGAEFENAQVSASSQTTKFLDLHWPGHCIIEMKRPSRTDTLSESVDQVHEYWMDSADEPTDRPAAEYVVLCSFHRFEIWQPGRFPRQPRATLDLRDLPDHYEALLFLQSTDRRPSFLTHDRAMSTEAAALVAELHSSLTDRLPEADEIQRFVMQSVWTMFAEDLGMIGQHHLQDIVHELLRQENPSSDREIGHYFEVLNRQRHHSRARYPGAPYVNGRLFENPAHIDLSHQELALLARACEYDWSHVDPTIFGSLLEGIMGEERRFELGAHYTHEADILKIVEPTIVREWEGRIEGVESPSEGVALLEELCSFRVLDPACGCGNFLYIAYRELRALESRLKDRIRTLANEQGLPVPTDLPFYRIVNLQGLDIDPLAVQIAKVTLWMGHRQMIREFGEAEPPLPLANLDNLRTADALRTPWPETDAIVGNPPFVGDRKIRERLGDAYVEWLKNEFEVGVIDLSGYWFRRAVDHMEPGQRAGLVSTNTLRENKHRKGSLDYVVESGGTITDAVSSQRWPGEARVHVSLTCWVMDQEPDGPRSLDGVQVPRITTQLRSGVDSSRVAPLKANAGKSFVGVQPTGRGFVLSAEEAERLIGEDLRNAEVVRPYLLGEDIADEPRQQPRKWIIDFGAMPLEHASSYTAPMRVVRQRVKPGREGSRPRIARRWWQFEWARPEMRRSLPARYPCCKLTGKGFAAAWGSSEWTPSNSVGTFALDGDFDMGSILSAPHVQWAFAHGSTFETRLRYTSDSTWATFPWPGAWATEAQRERVAAASRALLKERSRLCREYQVGLTTLYNTHAEGGYQSLTPLQLELDRAVAACYGWPEDQAQDEPFIVASLVELNRAIAAGEVAYRPFPEKD